LSEDREPYNASPQGGRGGISYLVAPCAGPLEACLELKSLTREQAIKEYGQTTIEAMETIIMLNPGQTLALQGCESVLMVDYVLVDYVPQTGSEE
jgi:hypothetical protein